MELLRLAALDTEDLAIISAQMQDAVLLAGDMSFDRKRQQFVLLANRFDLTDNFYVEPLAGFMYGSYQFGNVPYNGALGAGTSGQINLGSYQSALGRLGANVGYLKFTPKATWNPL